MHLKRRLSALSSSTLDEFSDAGQSLSSKRRRHTPPTGAFSALSDELLIRILGHLTEDELLSSISPISRRFHRLASDSQLWRAHYYTRFVLPRALRIPGFRGAPISNVGNHRLRYSARRAVWADGGWGRRGGFMDVARGETVELVDWKKQYKLRHNWARGKCAVDEVRITDTSPGMAGQKTLVKVVEGVAVTADSSSGLRAWDLRTRRPIAQMALCNEQQPNERGHSLEAQPTCLSVDDQGFVRDVMEIIVGFDDGAFGIWQLNLRKQELVKRYCHEKSSNGGLAAVAYGYPYALTATSAGLISLYSFARRPVSRHGNETDDTGDDTGDDTDTMDDEDDSSADMSRKEPRIPTMAEPWKQEASLPAPHLLTSLKSHTTRPPLALAIRKMATATSASIAYTFDSRNGWCLGIQDINIQPSLSKTNPETLSSRLAYTLPIKSGPDASSSSQLSSTLASSSGPPNPDVRNRAVGPTSLCYNHPYLLATLPDNTLILHLCTSTSASLSISPGMRLWGHTSGISGAEITPRGKAVSVSTRGNEIRVWELEGRVGGTSIEVRPRQQQSDSNDDGEDERHRQDLAPSEFGDKRNWVGFDDEMVIILKEAGDGRESLMVYDFT